MPEEDFFRHPLRVQINLKHPLVKLSDLIADAYYNSEYVSEPERFMARNGVFRPVV